MTKPVTGSIDVVNGEATVYFKPNENFNGTANFTYTATDSGNADGSNVLTSTPANGTITVTRSTMRQKLWRPLRPVLKTQA
jgi:hypothetical protein